MSTADLGSADRSNGESFKATPFAFASSAALDILGANGRNGLGEAEYEIVDEFPPEDPLSPDLLNQMMLRASPKFESRFTMESIKTNLEHAKAARKQMDLTQHPSRVETDSQGSVVEIGVHDLEIQRQEAAVEEVDKGVAEESGVNREIVDHILERLDNSRKCLESLAKLVAALSSAESAYAAAMAAAGKLRISCIGDDDQIQQAAAALSRLPSVISQAHRPLFANLGSSTADVQRLLDSYKAACKEVSAEGVLVSKHIQQGRRALSAAVAEHANVCRTFDVILAERARGRPMRAPDLDPWATEARLVQEHKALQAWQDRERSFLKSTFSRVSHLELTRLSTTQEVMTTVGVSYRAALLPMQHDLQALSETLLSVNPNSQLTELQRMAAVATDNARALADKQAESVQGVCQELFCSPEIIRQGDMQSWNGLTSRWTDAHFVLTRAGYLHWFTDMEQAKPLDVLNLSRCQFEQGEAPCLIVMETRSTGFFGALKARKLTFQAASIEECCEWAIAIRETIAVAAGKQLAFEGS